MYNNLLIFLECCKRHPSSCVRLAKIINAFELTSIERLFNFEKISMLFNIYQRIDMSKRKDYISVVDSLRNGAESEPDSIQADIYTFNLL